MSAHQNVHFAHSKRSGLAALLALALITSWVRAEETAIEIGHAGPLTGPLAHSGKDNENGVRLALDEANAEGINLGGKKVTFVLLSEDDQADPRQSTIVAQKLVTMASLTSLQGRQIPSLLIKDSKTSFALPRTTRSKAKSLVTSR